jgi:hypothetical protein
MGSSLQNAGLTPQMAVVNPNGTPTMFFFRWLLAMQGAALTSDDLALLESFDVGALDAALVEALAAASDAQMLAAGANDATPGDLGARVGELDALRPFSGDGGPGEDPGGDHYALEALIALPAPADPPPVIGRDVYANIPTGLNQGDTGRLFYATDRKLTYIWTGTAWQIVVNYEPIILDTLANWTAANYNPANYAAGQQFLVTTWQVTYTVEGGLWTYSEGTYIAPAASRPATAFNGAALGPLDIGLQFLASDTRALQYWNGSAWIAYPAVSGAAPTGPAGGDLAGTYPNPTVKQASGAFTALGAVTQQNLAGGATYTFNIAAGAGAGFVMQEAGVSRAQFVIAAGNTYLDYDGAWNIRVGFGGPTAVTFDTVGDVTFNQLVRLTPRTVASLPSPAVGEIACINDALAPVVGNAVVGGGTANALVWWNGAHWGVFAV